MQRRLGAHPSEAAVTPVIGAVLILGITILGIGGVLYWGAPMIDRIQSQNAQSAMVGEFEDLRDSSRDLSVPDHSRFPTIVLPRGEVTLLKGDRLMVTSDRDSGNVNCDFHVTNWADTTAPHDVTVGSLTGCRASATLQIYSVSGTTLVSVYNPGTAAVAGTVTVATSDFSTGDWLFRLQHASCTSTICAEAWVHSGDQVQWTLGAASGNRAVSYETGAIYSNVTGTLFQERDPGFGDAVFGSSYYGLWLRTLTASSYSSISGAGSHQVYLSLLGNYDRVDSSTTYRLRFDIAGPLAQAWCNGLVTRNPSLPTGTSYKSQATSCGIVDTASGSNARSVCYAHVASTADACTTTALTSSSVFTFRFLHARIYTSLAI